MKQPKVELKKVSFPRNIANDSFCYTADVHVNGKKAFMASNDGWGGADHFDPFNEEGRDLYRLLDDYIDTLPKKRDEDLDFEYKETMESFISNLAQDIYGERLLNRKAKSIIKKITYIDQGDLRSFKGTFDPKNDLQPYIDAIKSYGTPEVIIVNTLNKEIQTDLVKLMINGDMPRTEVREKMSLLLESEGLTSEQIAFAVTREGEEPFIDDGLQPS